MQKRFEHTWSREWCRHVIIAIRKPVLKSQRQKGIFSDSDPDHYQNPIDRFFSLGLSFKQFDKIRPKTFCVITDGQTDKPKRTHNLTGGGSQSVIWYWD